MSLGHACPPLDSPSERFLSLAILSSLGGAPSEASWPAHLQYPATPSLVASFRIGQIGPMDQWAPVGFRLSQEWIVRNPCLGLRSKPLCPAQLVGDKSVPLVLSSLSAYSPVSNPGREDR